MIRLAFTFVEVTSHVTGEEFHGGFPDFRHESGLIDELNTAGVNTCRIWGRWVGHFWQLATETPFRKATGVSYPSFAVHLAI